MRDARRHAPAQPSDIVATVPPDLVEITVEKVAIAAVMAGCQPGVPAVGADRGRGCLQRRVQHARAAGDDDAGRPVVIVCSGPGTRAIGMNSGGNALGQGNRANSTIGRALQLVVRNIGGGRPGEVDRAPHGNPGKLELLLRRERRRVAVRHARRRARDRARRRCADACSPARARSGVVDQLSREPELAGPLARDATCRRCTTRS